MGRLFAIGDIHGCFDQFHELVTEVIDLKKEDRLILLGDYIDRGASPFQTLRLLLTQAAIVYQKALLYETLKEREESLTKAQQISHVGSWHYDHASGEVSWSAETYRIYELDPFSVPADGDWMMNHVHPADAKGGVQAGVKETGFLEGAQLHVKQFGSNGQL